MEHYIVTPMYVLGSDTEHFNAETDNEAIAFANAWAMECNCTKWELFKLIEREG